MDHVGVESAPGGCRGHAGRGRDARLPGGARPATEAVRHCAHLLARSAGDTVDFIVFYGSRLHGAGADRHSAPDFVVVVTDYARFHRGLREAALLHRPAWMLTLLAGVLPPSSLAFRPRQGDEGLAKCLVVSRRHFERALGRRPPDHFLLGRLSQSAELIWARDAATEAEGRVILREALERVFDWVAPYLPPRFDADVLGRRILEVSYRAELRPEARDRALLVHRAQKESLEHVLVPVLETGVHTGRLISSDAFYTLAAPPSWMRRIRVRSYFVRSLVRSTARWLKHVLTFEGWLEYAARKVERHTGEPVRLGPLERRLPLLFLWPRVIRVLRERPGPTETR